MIRIDPLPAPSRYPDSAADVWALVYARPQGGTDLLARQMLDHDRQAIIVSGSGFPTDSYQSCNSGMVSMLCMSIHGVRMFIERFFSTEDDMAKKAKKAKKTAKAATKKVAKKTSKKKK